VGEFSIKKSFILFSFTIVSLILVTSCGKVTARDVLKQSKDADIIQFDGFIFSNATWYAVKAARTV
jgi:hypothetical protein